LIAQFFPDTDLVRVETQFRQVAAMRELLKTEIPESRMSDLQREMASFEIDRYGSVLQHLIIKSAST
jgi:hypothetical protein